MTTPVTPQVDCEQHHPGLAVNDVVAAADFYTKKLGFSLAFTWGDPPTMAGVNLDRVQIFLEHGTPSPKGCSSWSRRRTGLMRCVTTRSEISTGIG
ncbi:MAG: VOC family protein [Gemmatimonadota bacterium]